jgi:NTE family protein
VVDIVDPVSPFADRKPRGPSPGIGLAVSGGGYRAMLFHLGAFLRLFELGLLQRLDRISSVSGGSITAAKVALEWPRLRTREEFFEHVVGPIRRLAGITIDIPCGIAGILLPGGVAHYVALAYRAALFGGAALRDLPRKPEFVINATNVETGTLWRFSRDYMGDWKAGTVRNPQHSLANAVAASTAFPPFLSPYVLGVEPGDFTPKKNVDPRLRSQISLSDGGVYDNLGLERIWKAYQNVLVSDAGAALDPDPSPPADWGRHAKRVIDIIHGQSSSLRKRQLIASYKAKPGQRDRRRGTYWGIGSDAANYRLPDALPAPHGRTSELAKIPTRLRRLDAGLQQRLVNWGYAICDTAIRRHFPQKDMPPAQFPYAGGV